MSARPWRWRALFGALAMAIVLSAVSGKGRNPADEALALPRPRSTPPARVPAEAAPRLELAPLQRRDAGPQDEQLAGTAFGATSWHVPPPPPPPRPVARPLPPPPPAPPPMPFAFLGRYEDGAVRTILLVRNDRIYTVTEGEVIDNTYRVERLAGGQLELTYLPLGIRQSISAGGS